MRGFITPVRGWKMAHFGYEALKPSRLSSDTSTSLLQLGTDILDDHFQLKATKTSMSEKDGMIFEGVREHEHSAMGRGTNSGLCCAPPLRSNVKTKPKVPNCFETLSDM
jgi:hypothetical protein